jgi:[ribosomal protein S18]-alanine N-acetyltransferase
MDSPEQTDPPPRLRAPEPADYDAIAQWLPDAQATLRWAGPLVRWPFTGSTLPVQLAAPRATSRVLATPDDPPLGFGQYWPRDDGAVHLGRLLVAPGLRGRGFGRLLIDQLIAELRAVHGPVPVTLRVYRDNARALALYTQRGFIVVAELGDPDVEFMRLDP